MANLNTTNFVVQCSDETLILRKKVLPTLIGIVAIGIVLCFLLVIPFAGIFIYRHNFAINIFFACIFVLGFSVISVPGFIRFQDSIKKRIIIFDKKQDQILVDGQFFCALSNLSSVNVDQGGRTNNFTSFRLSTLYLKTSETDMMIIDKAGGIGPSLIELEEVGQTVVDFTGVKSNMI